MGSLVEVAVIRRSDEVKFQAMAWTREDGLLEVFWYEKGSRLNFLFDAQGNQVGIFHGCKRYKVERL